MLFAFLLLLLLGIWYVRELRGLYQEKFTEDISDINYSLEIKIRAMKRFFRRTRFAMYVFSPTIFIAALYGIGYLENPSIIFTDWLFRLIKGIIFYEILTVIATEIYFAVLYTPAFNELKNLLRQLNSE